MNEVVGVLVMMDVASGNPGGKAWNWSRGAVDRSGLGTFGPRMIGTGMISKFDIFDG